MSNNATLVTRLRNRREMVNYGNGDVRDIPDEDCEEAAARIAELEAALEGAEQRGALILEVIAERDRLKAALQLVIESTRMHPQVRATVDAALSNGKSLS